MFAVKPMFADKKFFFLQRVPMRTTFIGTIEKYGGFHTKLEPQADYIIADHIRKDAPFGSVSYKFIEDAERVGELPDVEKYTKGQQANVTRTPSSTLTTTGNKSTRTPFTAEDDRILYHWVTTSTGAEKGNELYKGLELKYPHHTYQSWRDRWIRYVRDRPPPAGVAPDSSLPSPPTERVAPRATATAAAAAVLREQPAPTSGNNSPAIVYEVEAPDEVENVPPQEPLGNFTQEDLDLLLGQAKHIENIPFKSWKKAWKTWAQSYTEHTAKEWEDFYVQHAQPEYRRLHPETESEDEEQDDEDGQWVETTTEVMAQHVKGSKAVPATQTNRTVEKGRLPEKPGGMEPAEAAPVKNPKPAGEKVIQQTEAPKRARDSPEAERPQFKRPRMASDDRGDDTSTERVATFARTDTSEADNLARMQLLSEDRRQRAELTRENLAQTTASTKSRSERAVDLQVDDEEDDQNDFVSYLSTVLGPAAEKIINDNTAEDDQELSDGDLQSMQDDLLTRGRLQNEPDDLPDDSSQADPGDVTLRPDHVDDEIPHDEPDNQSVSESQGSLPVRRSGYQQHESLFVQSSSPAPFPQSHSRDEQEGPRRVDLGVGDLEVPEPEGGWDDILSQASTANALPSVEDVLSRKAAKAKAQVFETQDLYTAQTQQVDFALPEPDFLDEPDFDEQEPFEEGAGEEDEDVEAWMKAQENQGYNKKAVYQALYWSCNRTELAEEALEYLDDNGAFPTVWSGFWSEKDDDAINGTDPNEIRRAEKLHGTRGTEQRRRFLAKAS